MRVIRELMMFSIQVVGLSVDIQDSRRHRLELWEQVAITQASVHLFPHFQMVPPRVHRQTNHLNRELGSLPHIYKTLIRHS